MAHRISLERGSHTWTVGLFAAEVGQDERPGAQWAITAFADAAPVLEEYYPPWSGDRIIARNEESAMPCNVDRRQLLVKAAAALSLGAGVTELQAAEANRTAGAHDVKEVLAVEDLMREHGVLRRALLVYAEAASRAAQGDGEIPMDALGRTAALFRTFGEDYHERALEERHVFVPLIRMGGQTGALADTLAMQHRRGREITDYISAVARKGRLDSANRASFAGTLTQFVRMYEHHAAIEDTIVFPAWKRAISAKQYDELSDEFEELEHKMFGKDGFEDALERIAAIEQSFGLADLKALTAPAPPPIGEVIGRPSRLD